MDRSAEFLNDENRAATHCSRGGGPLIAPCGIRLAIIADHEPSTSRPQVDELRRQPPGTSPSEEPFNAWIRLVRKSSSSFDGAGSVLRAARLSHLPARRTNQVMIQPRDQARLTFARKARIARREAA